MDSQALERLRGKWLLLDTSVLIRTIHQGDNVQRPLATIAEKYECILTVHDLIVQEFLSYTIRQDTYAARVRLIQQYPSLSVTDQEREKAVHISRIYAVNKIKTPSVADCVTAAFVQKYTGKVCLLTNDVKDFPAVLFDTFYVWPMNSGTEVDLFCFLGFSDQKTTREERKLVRASQ